ncbi:hypothetical protein ALC53_08661 [Atta colombica]|uniref:Uncharacterized protein n=1 Tax=Atta colombica TaxID=520822 RepID=A0A151I214_9HYME|nr:hypothetical protein ALC53_08661 [Atta colombica]
MVDNAYLLRRRGAFSVAINFSGGDSRTSWYILPGKVTSKGPPDPSGVAPSESHLNRMTNELTDTRATKSTDAEGSRRDAALTIIGVDPAVAGYLAPSLLVPVTTTPGCVVRLRGAMQVRGLFPNLKTWFGGKKFSSNEEVVIVAVNEYFADFETAYFK